MGTIIINIEQHTRYLPSTVQTDSQGLSHSSPQTTVNDGPIASPIYRLKKKERGQVTGTRSHTQQAGGTKPAGQAPHPTLLTVLY